MITRRTFIKRSAQAGLIAAVGATGVPAHSKQAPLALQPLNIPPVISGGDLRLAQSTARIFPDTDTNLFLINNTFIGPTIKVKKGDSFAATIHNDLPESTVLHWHGLHSPSSMSGHPKSAIGTGESYSVNFPIRQRACTSFYHAHPHMNTGKQVYMGLAGLLIVEDDEEKTLNLPSGEYDIPLLVQDKRFDANNQLIYGLTEQDKLSGWLGDTILANGTPNAFLAIAPTLYRFRIVNGSNSRFYTIGLSNGTSFTVIGNDGGFIEAPVSVKEALMGPAERLEILIDFSAMSQGETVTLKSVKFTLSDGPGSGKYPQGTEMDILQFQVSKTGSSNAIIPTALPAIEKYDASTAIDFLPEWEFAALHHINEQMYDMMRIDAVAPFNTLMRWTIESEAANTHPIHIHGAFFQVLDRDGAPPHPLEGGWKDTVILNPLERDLHILIKFTEYTGEFLIHCHKLEHSDAGMMANFEVTDSGAVKEQLEDSFLMISPNPANDHTEISFEALMKDSAVTLSDLKGTILKNISLPRGTTHHRIDTSSLPNGRYDLQIGQNKSVLLVKR